MLKLSKGGGFDPQDTRRERETYPVGTFVAAYACLRVVFAKAPLPLRAGFGPADEFGAAREEGVLALGIALGVAQVPSALLLHQGTA